MKWVPHWLKLPHHNCKLECPAKYSELHMQIMNVNKNSITIFRRMGVSLDSRCLCCRCSLSSLYKSQQEKDAADARAILEVMCSPDMMFVEIKAPAHQAVLLARQVRSTWWLSPLRPTGCLQSLHLTLAISSSCTRVISSSITSQTPR